jgi:hypothetical protein
MYKKNYNLGWAQCWHTWFELLFEKTEINNALEFGLGLGTEYLLDNVKYLHSVELSVSDLNKNWTEKIKSTCGGYDNWKLDYIECPESIVESNILVQSTHHPMKDETYRNDLYKLVDPFIDNQNWDLIFVDCGIHHRGDIVNRCMEKTIPLIAAHDTNHSEIYGYNLVNNDKYHKIRKDTNNGTTFWVLKTHFNFNLIVNSI